MFHKIEDQLVDRFLRFSYESLDFFTVFESALFAQFFRSFCYLNLLRKMIESDRILLFYVSNEALRGNQVVRARGGRDTHVEVKLDQDSFDRIYLIFFVFRFIYL